MFAHTTYKGFGITISSWHKHEYDNFIEVRGFKGKFNTYRGAQRAITKAIKQGYTPDHFPGMYYEEYIVNKFN